MKLSFLLIAPLLATGCNSKTAPSPQPRGAAVGTVGGAPNTSTPVPGVVLRVAGVDIRATEINAIATILGTIRPGFSQTALRREALTTLVLPRVACAVANEGEREAAETRARERLLELHTPDLIVGPSDPRGVREGTWRDLGVLIWAQAAQLEVGQWSEPIEDVGRFALVRRLPYNGPYAQLPNGQLGVLRVELEEFHFDTRKPAEREALLEGQGLEIFDPAWESVLPTPWKDLLRREPR